jgi:hypothetical protein
LRKYAADRQAKTLVPRSGSDASRAYGLDRLRNVAVVGKGGYRETKVTAISSPCIVMAASFIMTTCEKREDWCEKHFAHDEERSFKPNKLNFRV